MELRSLGLCAAEFYGASRFLGRFDMERFCEVWTALLGNGAGVIFIDERDGEVAGAIGGIVHRDIYGESLIAEEMFWFVREAFRGAGLALYRELNKWAVAMKATSLHMMHLADLMPDKVKGFYLRQGFDLVETRYVKRLTA